MRFELNAECLTPLFTAGGNPEAVRQNKAAILAEGLRPAELRGALRFWFRAAVGGYLSLEEMYRQEDRLFGGTEVGRTFRITTHPLQVLEPISGRLRMNAQGITKFALPPTMPSQSVLFRVVIETLRPASSDDAPWLRALALLSLLGGVGGRTRRGFGSLAFQLLHPKPDVTLFRERAWPAAVNYFPFDAEKSPSFEAGVEKQLRFLLTGLWTNYQHPPVTSTSRFSVLTRSHCRIYILRPKESDFWDNWEDAMNAIRVHFYHPLKIYLDKSALGSPNRLASPLALQIKRCPLPNGTGGYFGLAVAFHHQDASRYLTDHRVHPSRTLETFVAIPSPLHITGIDPFLPEVGSPS